MNRSSLVSRRGLSMSAVSALALVAVPALAEPPELEAPVVVDTANVKTEAVDPTGGAYTSPTLLFIPAAAVPVWNVRFILSSELQRPSDSNAAVRPGLGVELGLPAGFTIGAGTNWVGGYPGGNVDFSQGLSPYAQARLHILGRQDGLGWQLGTSATYKFVGFQGDPGEVELALSLQYRRLRYEVGLQGVIGQDFGDSDNHDGEVHGYAVYRVIPELALGVAGQGRFAISPPAASDPDAPPADNDLIGGIIASLTLSRFQIGALGGVSTVGITPSRPTALATPGGLGQLFASARF